MSPLINTHFKPYEEHLKKIIDRYPEPSNVLIAGKAAGTVRQALKRALQIYLSDPSITSTISRHSASLVERNFSFSDNPDGSLYIGPRRARTQTRAAQLSITGLEASKPSPLPPIDCTNPTTLHSILHLKNFDHLPDLEIRIFNFPPLTNLTSTYPNIEFIENPDGTVTVL